ncbi:alpha/beta fold hydrolase [Faunimonas sp. B44]|uniref:alpha/beta fold hydrolase n=1 Tax=Faunimonas sp. B44 TaxID=3461493 RepID=UPI0040444190
MGGRLEIRVLGEFAVTRDGEPVPMPPSKKTRALLAYLAVTGKPHRRERLCELFWDIPDDPRGALRWSLSKLRQVLGEQAERLQADRNSVAFAADGIDLDYGAILALGAEYEHTELDRLEHAASLFRGRFIEDLALTRCDTFEAWRIALSDEMELARLRLLRTLVERLAHDPLRVLPHAHMLHQLAPDDEAIARRVAELSAAARQSATSGARPLAAAHAATDEPDRGISADSSDRSSIRSCKTRDGVRLAYAATGAGPPIIKAANWMSHLQYDQDSPVWRHWIRGLAECNELIRYDARGNGLSQWDVADLSFEAMVADLESIVDAAGHRRFWLLGISQGCAISVAYAVRHPERVCGLILYGGYVKGWRARGDPHEIARREAMGTLIREGWGQQSPVFRQIFTSLFVPGASQEQMDWFNELQRLSVSPEIAARLHEAFGDIDVSALLAQVGVPTLVLHCADDCVSPLAAGKAFAEGIPDARFVELHGSNHIMLDQEPAFARFLEEVRSFTAVDQGPAADRSPSADQYEMRRQVTVITAELISPLQAFEFLDPEAGSELGPIVEALVETIRAHQGMILASGDGCITAAFGAYGSTEAHAYLACRAALAAQAVVAARSEGRARLRIGIDVGDVLVRRRSDADDKPCELTGAPPRIAAQLMRSLRRGIIAATARAREAAGGYVTMEALDRSEHQLFSAGARVFRLIGENSALSRWHLRANQGLTALTGRDTELRLLKQAWQRVREGSGQTIAVIGEPGIGKSRLTHEFIGMPEVADFTVLESGALELDANLSFGFVKKLIGNACSIGDRASAAAALERLEAKTAQLELDPRLKPALASVLDLPVACAEWPSLDGGERRRRIREAVRAFLAAESLRRPMVVLLEDLHWIDGESEGVVARLTEANSACRILLLATCRPGYAAEWLQKRFVQQISLQPLGMRDSEAFLDRLLGSDAGLEAVKELVIERADGVPLFMEEWVRSLVDSGRVVRAADGFRLAGEPDDIQIPASVQSVIASRMARLERQDLVMIQSAAVVGRDVPRVLLEAVLGWPPDVFEGCLERLKHLEFLFELQSFPVVEYTFKHALTHRAAYESMTSEARRGLHREVLRAIKSMNPPHGKLGTESLAEHAMRAEEWREAADYSILAADRAIERSAYQSAASFLENAACALDRLPDDPERMRQAIDVRTRMRPVYDATGAFAKAVARLDEAQAIATQLQDSERLIEILIHQSYINSSHGRIERAVATADELKELAQAEGVARYVAEADLAAAQAFLMRAQAREALARLEPHRTNFTVDWRHDRFGLLGTRSVWYLGHVAQAKALLGDFAGADGAASEAERVAIEVNRPFDLLAARYSAAIVAVVRGPDEAFLLRFRNLVSDDHTEAAASFRPWLLAVLGHAEYQCGLFPEAERTLCEALAQSARLDLPQFEIYTSAVLACARAGQGGEAGRGDLKRALAAARGQNDVWIEATTLRALAQAVDDSEAIPLLRTACEVTERAGHRPEFARSKRQLATALARTGQDGAARMLADAMSLFRQMGMPEPRSAERQPEASARPAA